MPEGRFVRVGLFTVASFLIVSLIVVSKGLSLKISSKLVLILVWEAVVAAAEAWLVYGLGVLLLELYVFFWRWSPVEDTESRSNSWTKMTVGFALLGTVASSAVVYFASKDDDDETNFLVRLVAVLASGVALSIIEVPKLGALAAAEGLQSGRENIGAGLAYTFYTDLILPFLFQAAMDGGVNALAIYVPMDCNLQRINRFFDNDTRFTIPRDANDAFSSLYSVDKSIYVFPSRTMHNGRPAFYYLEPRPLNTLRAVCGPNNYHDQLHAFVQVLTGLIESRNVDHLSSNSFTDTQKEALQAEVNKVEVICLRGEADSLFDNHSLLPASHAITDAIRDAFPPASTV